MMRTRQLTLAEVLHDLRNSDKGITYTTRKEDIFVSYGELYGKAQEKLYVLQQKGMQPKDELVFQVEDNGEFITLFWACQLGGIIPVPLAAGNNEDHKLKLARVWNSLRQPYLACSKEILRQIEKYAELPEISSCIAAMKRQAILTDEDEGVLEPRKGNPQPMRSEDIALIQYSSGSTGTPKGVILTHGNILCNIYAIIEGAGVSSADSSLSWMPLTHDMGLIGCHLTAFTANINQFIMQPTLFVMDPELWLHKAHEHGITLLSSPNFGYKHFLSHCKKERIAEWNLSRLRLIFNGAEPVSAKLCNRFLDAIGPTGANRNILFPVYGMAEASLAVTFPPTNEEVIPVYLDRNRLSAGEPVRDTGPDDKECVTFVDVGYPVQDCQVRVCDDDGGLLIEGYIGNIQIKGSNVTQGYYRNPTETDKLLNEEGWLSTGDLGFLRRGRLVVTGRKKDIIFVRGQNYFPHDLESIVQEQLDIELGKIAICGIASESAGTDEIVSFIIHRGKPDSFVDIALDVKMTLNKATGLSIKHVIPVRSIPKTTSGKLQRYKLEENFVRGEFTEVMERLQELLNERITPEAMEASDDSLEWRLSLLWADALELGSVGIDQDFFELGGDSLTAALLLNRIHREFHVEIPAASLFDLFTVRKLADYMRDAETSIYKPISKAENSEYYPVSSSQYRVYVQEQSQGVGTSYNMPVLIHIEGELDIVKAEDVFRRLIGLHESLRTSFSEIDGDIVQIVHRVEDIEFALQTLSIGHAGVREAIDGFIRPFRLSVAPLFRAGIASSDEERTGARKHHLILDMHHAISDGISVNQLIEQFAKLYAGEGLPDSELQYKDYVMWHLEQKHSDRYERDRRYWERRLSGEVPLLEMPTDRKRTDARSFEGDSIPFSLDSFYTRKLNELAHRHSVTVNAILLTVYAILLNKYTRQQDIVVGSLVSGRNHADLESIVGMFVNYVPLRMMINPETTFMETLERCASSITEDYSHQNFPYEDMIGLVPARTPLGRNPLFDTMLILHNQMDLGSVKTIGDRKLTFEEWRTNTSKLDFKLDVYVEGSGLTCWLEYNRRLFDRETMERLCGHFEKIVHSALLNPHARLLDIDMLSGTERLQILRSFNSEETTVDSDESVLHKWFEQAAGHWPDRIAVLNGDQRITYRELNEKANRLAAELRRNGLGPDRIAAIVVERSAEMMIGILAILKAGGAYLPISPDYPPERIRFMLEDSGAVLLLTQKPWLKLFVMSEDGQHKVTCIPFSGAILDIGDEGRYRDDSHNEATIGVETVHSRNLAYVIYTSGSTGNPKGVMIEHRAAVNRIRWMQKQYPIGQNDVILQKTAYTFDVSVWELLWWFFAGAAVSFLPPGGEKDPDIIVRTIEEHRVTTLHFVPSMLHLFLEHQERRQETGKSQASLATLKYVFASGEALPPQHVERFYERFGLLQGGLMLVNLYGPTEAAIDVSYYDCQPEPLADSVPIGRPIDNIQLYVLDEARQLLPIGVPGELYIAGKGLARGYIQLQELTSEKFVDNPFVSGTRMYRTGDLAKWQADGTIVYMGRLDHQVKLRGYRIELGEIEAGLLRHPDIHEAVVTVKATPEGDKYLSAHMVSDQTLTIADIRGHLDKLLPEYMIPARYSLIGKMPLTSSGKVDRKALANLEDVELAAADYEAPLDSTEEALIALWQTVLHRERIGALDNFFEIGGHSLKATELLNKLHKELRATLSLKEIFDNPTVRKMANVLRGKGKSDVALIPPSEEKEHYALSPAQSRLYVLQQFEQIGTAYHLPAAFLYEGTVDQDRFEKALSSVVGRHESLRTSFRMVDGVPVQKVHPSSTVSIERRDGSQATLPEVIGDFIRPFDLNEAPLMRASIVQLHPNEQLILFDMHHLVSDGVSMGVLVEDFVGFYEGEEPDKPVVPYKDFAVWQREALANGTWREQERYWVGQFADGVPTLNMLADYNRPSMRSFEGDKLTFRLTEEETHALRKLAADLRITIYMAMLAVFNVFLSRYSGQDDIVVGTPVSGRSHADLHNAVGMFVNTLPIRNYPSAHKTFKSFAEELRENTLGAFSNQDYPFEELVGKLQLTRSLSRNPLFDAMFVMQNMTIPELTLDQLPLKRCESPHVSAKFDFTLEVVETEETEIECHFEYCTKLFREETVGTWVHHFRNILKEVTVNPEIAIGNIDMLSSDEISQLLSVPDDEVRYPREKTIHGLFEDQVERTPDNIAVVCGNERITYRELNEKANRLAVGLRSKGVVPDQRVGLMLDRSIDMIVGILAVLKAGGAYVPIDPDYPAERAAYMIADSEASIVVTESKYEAGLRLIAPEVIDIAQLSTRSGDFAKSASVSGNLAYIIYTSGTTGKPKGVMIEHRNVVSLMVHDPSLFDFNANDAWTMFHSYCFDFSVWEMYGALLFGGKLVVLEKQVAQDPERLLDVLIGEKVTVFNQTPSSFYHLIRYESAKQRPELQFRYVIFGGEALKPSMLGSWKQRYPDTKLVNMYGITETTVHVTYKEMTDVEISSNVSRIGQPIPTLNTYILDGNLKLLPVGVAGELYVGGKGVARGYLNRPELTEQKFIANPYRPGETLYRSGDLVRMSTDGELEYMGRIDHQVKVRGFRIELGEIEHGLQQHPHIREAVVLAKDDAAGEKALWGYVAVKEELPIAELRKHLSATLPDYMIPSFYVQMEKLPLTVNGKIDRNALLRLEAERRTSASNAAPRNELERKISEIWQDVLSLDSVGAHDNFFDVGGHSLLLLRLHSLLEQDYPGVVKVTDLFTYPTIHALAAFIEAETASDSALGTMRHVELPESFFANRQGQPQRTSLTFQLDSRMTSDAKRMAEDAQGDLDSVLAGAYLYLFAQLTKKAEQTIYVMARDQTVHVVDIDLSGQQEAFALVCSVQQHLVGMRAGNEDVSVTKPLNAIPPSPESGIYPLFYKYGRSGASANMDEAFDIALSFFEENDRITLLCSYDERKLRKEKMKEFCQGYVKMVGWLTKPYASSRQTAAGKEGATHE
ncbi:non-ribosomal peptide synthetase [Cohnella sp. WQ 127256]|uniref:non-ribosomal peptide synthetase n=1 Tax=Cohnella sp. WQ 127256 TaxID=2938790 RepID=UPI00211762E1|nr:non-ribosomal peptide synthetase [Cohnella sp. WQ 127256]